MVFIYESCRFACVIFISQVAQIDTHAKQRYLQAVNVIRADSDDEELEEDVKGGVKGGDKRESNEGEDKIIEEEFEDQSGEVDVDEENGFKNNFEWQNHGKNIFSKSDFDFKVGKLAATSKSKEEE